MSNIDLDGALKVASQNFNLQPHGVDELNQEAADMSNPLSLAGCHSIVCIPDYK